MILQTDASLTVWRTFLVLSETEIAHKSFKIANSETSPINFHKGQSSEVNTFPNQQYDSAKVSIENGGNQEQRINTNK